MSNYITNSFSNLTYNLNSGAKSATGQLINTGIMLSSKYTRSSNGTLKYISNNAYKSRIVQAAIVHSMQMLSATLSNAYPAYKRYLEGKALKEAANKNKYTLIIEDEEEKSDPYPYLTVSDDDTSKRIYAINKYGKKVEGSIVLGIPTDKNIIITQSSYDSNTQSTKKEDISSQKVIWYNITPIVSMKSSKNVVLTKVEGRDYSRKELISGGDLSFSVSGEMVSGYPDVYPSNDVKKFIQVMQYGGIVQVSSNFFKQFNVSQILITDFSCNQKEGSADTQPFSFSCVAVEPDESVEITKDTIYTVNTSIAESKKEGWIKTLLSTKLDEIKGSAASTASTTITSIISNSI